MFIPLSRIIFIIFNASFYYSLVLRIYLGLMLIRIRPGNYWTQIRIRPGNYWTQIRIRPGNYWTQIQFINSSLRFTDFMLKLD